MTSSSNKIATNFYGKVSKEESGWIVLSVIITDSVFKLGQNDYPQKLWEECKHKEKEKKIKSFTINDVKTSSGYDLVLSN